MNVDSEVVVRSWFRLDRRLTFFCFAKRKVSKEKATHLVAHSQQREWVPCAAQPAGRLRNSVAMRPRPQTVLAESPRLASAARRLRWGLRSKSKAEVNGPHVLGYKLRWSGHKAFDLAFDSSTHEKRRATQGQAEKGRGLSEGGGRIPTEFRSPRWTLVAQGTRSRPLRTGAEPGSPFILATFLLAKQKKSTLARKGETIRLQLP